MILLACIAIFAGLIALGAIFPNGSDDDHA